MPHEIQKKENAYEAHVADIVLFIVQRSGSIEQINIAIFVHSPWGKNGKKLPTHQLQLIGSFNKDSLKRTKAKHNHKALFNYPC